MFTHVIYHKACPDGFGSAYIAWKVLGNKCKYIPQSYYDKPPVIKKSKILICDFSFKYDVTQKYIKNNELFFNIDHHKSAFENLENIDEKYKLFDINHSGIYLTWKYFFPDAEIPLFVKYIEDYDLWNFKYEETKPFMLALNQLPYKFEIWKKLEDEKFVKQFIKKGKLILTFQNNLINMTVKNCKIKKESINNKSYNIAYINTNLFKNEIANKIVSSLNCDFCVAYNYDDNKNITKFSLRSIDSKTDVGTIAKFIGGGGHRNAAGHTRHGFHNSII